jgi:hypothetical protein
MGNDQAKAFVESYIETGDIDDKELERCFSHYDTSGDGSLQKKVKQKKCDLSLRNLNVRRSNCFKIS